MFFFDCNTSYGYLSDCLRPIHSIKDLSEAMEQAGIQRAVVSCSDVVIEGNRRLAGDIQGYKNIFGVWTMLPSHTQELPGPEVMLKAMRENHIIGWRLAPEFGRYLPKIFVLRDWLEAALTHKIPLFVNTAHGTSLEVLADILEKYPEITVILTYKNVWPSDRLLRPFVAEFPNVYLDMTYWFIDGSIEPFVDKYGAGRLLYGSGFPECYFGANMLMLKHAGISENDKAAIAGANMAKIAGEGIYD